jgi:hypothetical protein
MIRNLSHQPSCRGRSGGNRRGSRSLRLVIGNLGNETGSGRRRGCSGGGCGSLGLMIRDFSHETDCRGRFTGRGRGLRLMVRDFGDETGGCCGSGLGLSVADLGDGLLGEGNDSLRDEEGCDRD